MTACGVADIIVLCMGGLFLFLFIHAEGFGGKS